MASFSLPLVITTAVASVAVAAVFGFHHIPCCGNKCPAPKAEVNQAANDVKLAMAILLASVVRGDARRSGCRQRF